MNRAFCDVRGRACAIASHVRLEALFYFLPLHDKFSFRYLRDRMT